MLRRAFVVSTAVSAGRVLGANERLRGGLIGAGGRGRYVAAEFKRLGAGIAAVSDVYVPNLEAGIKAAGPGAVSYRDYRKLLDDKSLDFVLIATPDHWHARMSIDAVQAGKDVYLEKPMAHAIDEGFRLVDAVRRSKRVVQIGTQRRSFDLFIEAKRVKESSDIGEVRLVNAWWYNHQTSLNPAKLSGELDWQSWLGSAPKRPLDPLRFFNWYYFWDYSGGLMVGQAAHAIDAIHWMMGSTYPSAVTCAGGQVGLPGAEVPETTSMLIEYPENYLAVFTVGYKAMRYASINDQLKQFHGSRARFDVGRESYALYRESSEVDLKPSLEKRRPGSFEGAVTSHVRNFLECIRSRQDPNATVEMGQSTNVVLSMAMQALRTGRRLTFDPKTRTVRS